MRALIDHHLHLDSALHRWHPAYKLAGAGIVAVAITGVNSVPAAGACVLLAFSTVLLGRLPWRMVGVRVAPLVGFFVFFCLLLALGPSPRDAALGGIGFSTQGLRLGGLIGLKCLAIVLLVTAVLATTPTVCVFKVLHCAGLPARLVELLLLSYRLVFALSEELDSLRRAASCRGFMLGCAPRRLGALGRLTGSLLVRSFERAERLYNAMLARGYGGTVRAFTAPRAGQGDRLGLTASVVVAAAALATRWWR